MILSFTHSPDFSAGGSMDPEQWTNPLEQVESMFQSKIRGENFLSRSIHGSSFRKNGLTQVFRRRNAGDVFTARSGGIPGVRDIPGGALRFRLRAEADVMVFFTATILRLNHWDASLPDATGDGPQSLSNSLYPYPWTSVGFRGYWEGTTREPGKEVAQAQSYLSQKANFVDKVNVKRQIFLCYRINPSDIETDSSIPPSYGVVPPNTTYAGSEVFNGQDSVTPLDPSDLRMVDTGSTSVGSNGIDDIGRLLPGWHSVRHTFHNADYKKDQQRYNNGLLADDGNRATLEPWVFANTELVVVADYGPRPSAIKQSEVEQVFKDRIAKDEATHKVIEFGRYDK